MRTPEREEEPILHELRRTAGRGGHHGRKPGGALSFGLEAVGLVRSFGGLRAVDDVSFQLEPGELLTVFGPNGAGKSTTMKVITGFVPPTEGTCIVAGNNILTDSLAARRHIGYLPETVPLYTDMTVSDYLAFMGKIRGLKGERLNKRVDDVVQICRLEEYFNIFISFC